MKKMWFKSLLMVLVLSMAVVPLVSASTVGPVDPLSPVPEIPSTGEMVNETPTAWFVEFRSKSLADGGSLKNTKADKDNFRKAAKEAGIEITERMAFDTLWNGVSISIAQKDVAKLAALPGVKGIYPVETIAIPETEFGSTPDLGTALAMTGADIAQNTLGYTGEGIKVAVMDTGIDYDHPDLGGCFGEGCRVYTGWDFVGDDFNADPTSAAYNPVPEPDPYPDDCNGHGTHVSGIIGANGEVVGVAPDVTYGAYRVFGCAGSTTSDIMLAAMEMALADGMDVLNMSIGSAFNWPQYPTAVAASQLVKKGMVVVASIGNSGANGLYSAGAPGLGEEVIGVASFDNTHVFLPYFTVNDKQIGYVTMTYSPQPPTSGTFEVVDVGLACDPLTVDLNGKVALAARGTCAFSVKAINATNAGAGAVLISNNESGIFNGTLGAPIPGVAPTVGISLEDGIYIRAQAAPAYMTWTDQMDSFPSPTGGLISSFSSYGLSPDLALKPDIGAPGGNIYSTYPLEGGGYATMGGTSMSSPHVAGAVALLLQAKPGLKATEVRGILQNSADPKLWSLAPSYGLLDNVHRQGAGMLDIDDAILATTVITPAKIATGEGEAGTFKQTIKLTNTSNMAVTYDLSYVNALSTGGVITPSFFFSDATVSFSKNTIKVPANGSATFIATITPATGPEFGQYGGYIIATPQDGGQVYRVPFAGFVGDYQGIQALTPTEYGFPWLAISYGGSFYGPVKSPEDWTYTMVGEDIPWVLVHFDHHVELFKIEIVNADLDKLVHPVFNVAVYEEYVPRNSTTTGFYAFGWDGTRIHKDGFYGKGNTVTLNEIVPDGLYQLVIKALKANGNFNKPEDWETWTSPVFTIDQP